VRPNTPTLHPLSSYCGFSSRPSIARDIERENDRKRERERERENGKENVRETDIERQS
jgi:hypothetical protein